VSFGGAVEGLYITATTSWQFFEVPARTATGTTFTLTVYGSGFPSIFVDSLILERTATYTGTFFDGNSTAAGVTYAWTGTANASASTATSSVTFSEIAGAIPSGGTTGQVLAKISGTNYETVWTAPVPAGTIAMFGSSTPPVGWLVCNGQSTAAYPALAAIVGATVPNLRDRFIVGAGTSYSQNATGGASTHSHSLTNNGYAKVRRAGNRIVLDEVTTVTWTADQEVSGSGTSSTQTGTAAAGLGGTTETASSMPPFYALTYIIKT
jgi:microcystin-dependent protein